MKVIIRRFGMNNLRLMPEVRMLGCGPVDQVKDSGRTPLGQKSALIPGHYIRFPHNNCFVIDNLNTNSRSVSLICLHPILDLNIDNPRPCTLTCAQNRNFHNFTTNQPTIETKETRDLDMRVHSSRACQICRSGRESVTENIPLP